MSEDYQVNHALEARVAELERQLAAQRGRSVPGPRVSRRLAAAFALTLVLLIPGVVLASHQFSDVPTGHPFHNDIDWFADYGITGGFGDGTYRPATPVTRQAIAAFMHRLSNQFELIRSDGDYSAGNAFAHSATCPGDKRAIAGGGTTNETSVFMRDSYPLTASSWYVSWETENNSVVDPTQISVWVLCAPRL